MIDHNELQERVELQRKVQATEDLVKKYLSREAIARYSNIKAVHPEKAMQVLQVMLQLIQAGRITNALSDGEFKHILQLLQQPQKEFRIKRI